MMADTRPSEVGRAVISECGRFRYTLEREIPGGNGRAVLFVMLNPSTADATEDDNTIRRCKAFVASWGYGRLLVANLYAWRATNPKELTHQPDQIGPDWVLHTSELAGRASLIVAAWGGFAASWRQIEVKQFLRKHGAVFCLGKTQDGSPRHPLYLPKATPLQEYVA
jgi:hypothetical protein